MPRVAAVSRAHSAGLSEQVDHVWAGQSQCTGRAGQSQHTGRAGQSQCTGRAGQSQRASRAGLGRYSYRLKGEWAGRVR